MTTPPKPPIPKGETQMTNKVTVKTCAPEPAKEPTINSVKPGTIFKFPTGSYYFIKADSGEYVRLHDGELISVVVADTIVCPVEAGKCVEIQVQ
jgi:hypothetical protein